VNTRAAKRAILRRMSDAVQLRVERTDGTLKPPIARRRDQSPFPTAVGTSFALADGRWVQVIGNAGAEDGTLLYVIAAELTEQRSYSASGHEVWVRDASEMRIGSPQYGRLILDGEPLEVGSVEEGSPVWSPDGRYLGVGVLGGWNRDPVTRTLVIDADHRAVVARSEAVPGFCDRSGLSAGRCAIGKSGWTCTALSRDRVPPFLACCVSSGVIPERWRTQAALPADRASRLSAAHPRTGLDAAGRPSRRQSLTRRWSLRSIR
jgi:hypothetical protein